MQGVETPSEETPIVEEIPEERPWPWWLAVLAIFFLALFLWSELRVRAQKERVAEVEAGQRHAAEENRLLHSNVDDLNAQLRTATNPSTHVANLSGVAAGAAGRALLDTASHRLDVYVSALPQPPAGMTYQLWVTPKGQAPRSSGVVSVDEKGNGSASVPDVSGEIASVSLTVEPHGGSPAPGGQLVLSGGPL